MGNPGKKDYGPAGHRKRLRDRFSKSGRGALADYELLELLLTYSIPRIDTKPTAKALLHRFGSFIGVLQQPTHRLMEVRGIGPQSAVFLKVIHAALTRCMESSVEDRPSISGPEDIFAFVRLHLGPRTNECVYALYLDDASRIIYHAEIAAGTVNRATIYPREVFKPALAHNATGVVLVHNHPEGQPVPSENDLEMTKMLEEVAAPLGVKLIDHMIVTRMKAYSLKTGKLF
jgi:DNA repair protein RadC